MLKVNAYKAQDSYEGENIESVALFIDKPFPDKRNAKYGKNLYDYCTKEHIKNAKQVMKAIENLPSGTRHQLIILMLKSELNIRIIK